MCPNYAENTHIRLQLKPSDVWNRKHANSSVNGSLNNVVYNISPFTPTGWSGPSILCYSTPFILSSSPYLLLPSSSSSFFYLPSLPPSLKVPEVAKAPSPPPVGMPIYSPWNAFIYTPSPSCPHNPPPPYGPPRPSCAYVVDLSFLPSLST